MCMEREISGAANLTEAMSQVGAMSFCIMSPNCIACPCLMCCEEKDLIIV